MEKATKKLQSNSANPLHRTWWYYEEMQYLCQTAKEKGVYRILFSQGEPYEGVESELCYQFGKPGTNNDGYHSLMLLAQMLSALFYRTDL